MSGLLFLSSDDFSINTGNKGNIMCHGIPGFSLVLFYSTSCQHCRTLIPIFKKLPGSIGGCQFGMINVSTNKKCIIMSQSTIAPIKFVPYIILYIQGKPFMRYNGPHKQSELIRFVMEVANKIQSKQRFTSENVKEENKENGRLREYSVGIPLLGSENRCYLDFEVAYKS